MPSEQTETRAAEGNLNVLPDMTNLNLPSPPLPRMGTFGATRTAERHHGDTTPNLNSTTQRENGTTICLLPVQDSVSFSPKQLYLAPGAEIKIGRVSGSRNQRESKPDNGVFLCDVMSREHAMIKEIDGQVWIKDMKSTHGTFVNNTRLGDGSTPSVYYPLNHKDLITFGHSVRRNQNLYKHLSAYVWYPTPENGQPPSTPIVLPPRETTIPGINATPVSSTLQANGFHTTYRQRPVEQDEASQTIRNLLPLTPSNRYDSTDRTVRDPKTHYTEGTNPKLLDPELSEGHLIKQEETSVEKEKHSRTETKASAKDRVYAPKESHVVKENHTMVKKEGTTSSAKEFDKTRENRVSPVTKTKETTTSRKDVTPSKPKESPPKQKEYGSGKSREFAAPISKTTDSSITGKSKETATSKTRTASATRTRETQSNDIPSDKNERDDTIQEQDSLALAHDNVSEDENLDERDKMDEEMIDDGLNELVHVGKKRSFAQFEEDDIDPTEEQVQELRTRLADAERRSKRIKWEVAISVIGGMIFGATSLAAGAVVFGG